MSALRVGWWAGSSAARVPSRSPRIATLSSARVGRVGQDRRAPSRTRRNGLRRGLSGEEGFFVVVQLVAETVQDSLNGRVSSHRSCLLEWAETGNHLSEPA